MSKSIGNVVHPRDIVGKGGMDLLRYWAITYVVGNGSIPVKPDDINLAVNELMIIRNHLKFILGYISGLPDPGTATLDIDYDKLNPRDKWCLNASAQFHDQVRMERSMTDVVLLAQL